MNVGATVSPLPAVVRVGPGHAGLLIRWLVAFVLLAAAGYAAPRWLTFLLTMAAGNGLVSLGIVGLMRGGVCPSARAWCSPSAATRRRCSTTGSASPTRSAWRLPGAWPRC
jgi:hypothetical protein